jgi:hypothetical protein
MNRLIFPRFGAALRTGVAAMALALPAACSSASFDGDVAGASRTGTYPNINERREAATTQLTDAEAEASAATLAARRDEIAAAQAAPRQSESERLRQLGATHGQRTIDEIEN